MTLAALEALAGRDPLAGAWELRRQSAHHGLSAVVRVLDTWIESAISPHGAPSGP